jgi:hypothetical protein
MSFAILSEWIDGLLRFIDSCRDRAGTPLPLVFLGDSHARYFERAAEQGRFGARRWRLCAVNGATAVGLRNPNAKTNAVEIFRRQVSRVRRDAVIVFQLGEVDCGFVMWYRAQKYRDTVDDQLDASIAAYFAFVDEMRARGYVNFVITGATVPTIKDGQDWGIVANARREVTATLRERTNLTRRYNQRLEENAAARGLPFIDIWDETVDPATGLVRPFIIHPNPVDHHLNRNAAAALWADKLNAVLPDRAQRARASRES